MNRKTVGFVGVGRMGGRMARNVLKAGFTVNVYDVSPMALHEVVAAGARAAGSPAEVASRSDVVLSVLPSPVAVEEALLGSEGVASGVRPGSIVAEMSTISPSLTRRFAKAFQEKGARYLDCPVSGGIPGAEKGTLTVLVGGEPEALEECRAVLEPMAGAIYHMGEIGAGLTSKLINQMLTMTQTVLVTEALAVGARSGLNLETLHELISKSSGTSWCWENRIPRILNDARDKWVTVDICHKDLGLAKALGEELGVPLFVSGGAFQVLQMAKAMSLGPEDISALGRLYEQMLAIRMRDAEEQ